MPDNPQQLDWQEKAAARIVASLARSGVRFNDNDALLATHHAITSILRDEQSKALGEHEVDTRTGLRSLREEIGNKAEACENGAYSRPTNDERHRCASQADAYTDVLALIDAKLQEGTKT